ncbi:MAG: acyl-CoA thioesterase II [Acidimicrobiaceae bacterium]|nr:acyl-CoA thioesterase II [Acidimicrobiaceae bacterium]
MLVGMSQHHVNALIDLLDLEPIEVNIFRGVNPDEERQRIFGGQVAGQALVAAARTVDDDRAVHSLHAYFLRPGDPNVPVLYEVDRIRDGRSFTTRRVAAIQHGRAIFHMSASFHIAEPGFDHLDEMPDVPEPDGLPTRQERFAAAGIEDTYGPSALDVRYITNDPFNRLEALPPTQRVWFRANGDLPDGQVLHTCLLTYASDMTLLDTTLLPHGSGATDRSVMMASLDHAMWFHGSFRADEWLLYDQHTPAASGARGLATGRVFTQHGRLVANVVQEGLIRRVEP